MCSGDVVLRSSFSLQTDDEAWLQEEIAALGAVAAPSMGNTPGAGAAKTAANDKAKGTLAPGAASSTEVKLNLNTVEVQNELSEEVAVSLATRLSKSEEDNFYLKQEVGEQLSIPSTLVSCMFLRFVR